MNSVVSACGQCGRWGWALEAFQGLVGASWQPDIVFPSNTASPRIISPQRYFNPCTGYSCRPRSFQVGRFTRQRGVVSGPLKWADLQDYGEASEDWRVSFFALRPNYCQKLQVAEFGVQRLRVSGTLKGPCRTVSILKHKCGSCLWREG